ncbi:hypothetical protein POX_f07562 [Penicillium oxalicum]|uniref:hypothetical protein n=1 Tax=Penicillium oxalicum TaxID=69781 RepID=UPI0020B8D43B|nr:hypothetical protein POX_f07562 [Penicillium oxalicum]KAI2787199.1 hypothetical protein POX_f07562 [Penicillium oxalicum]
MAPSSRFGMYIAGQHIKGAKAASRAQVGTTCNALHATGKGHAYGHTVEFRRASSAGDVLGASEF